MSPAAGASVGLPSGVFLKEVLLLAMLIALVAMSYSFSTYPLLDGVACEGVGRRWWTRHTRPIPWTSMELRCSDLHKSRVDSATAMA